MSTVELVGQPKGERVVCLTHDLVNRLSISCERFDQLTSCPSFAKARRFNKQNERGMSLTLEEDRVDRRIGETRTNALKIE